MVKIGVLGAGYLGKIHIKLLKQIKEYDLVGFYDYDQNEVNAVCEEFKLKYYDDPAKLLDEVDAIDIVTPTISHYECAVNALKSSKHIFIEKPITYTIEEASNLIKLTNEADVKVQVGHVERFNPAFTSAKPYINNPMFIEAHRLSQFKQRGADVSVVLDLMIHDIDIVLSTVKSNIKKVSASGMNVVTDKSDIASVRLEFDNGCVANLTASRISMSNMRKARFFQHDAYININFLDKEVDIVKIRDAGANPSPSSYIIDPGQGKPKKEIYFEKPEITLNNAIKDELKSFYSSITENIPTLVNIEDGYNALNVAYIILEKMKLTSNDV